MHQVDGRGIANVLHALACLELCAADIIDDLLYLSMDFMPTLSGQVSCVLCLSIHLPASKIVMTMREIG